MAREAKAKLSVSPARAKRTLQTKKGVPQSTLDEGKEKIKRVDEFKSSNARSKRAAFLRTRNSVIVPGTSSSGDDYGITSRSRSEKGNIWRVHGGSESDRHRHGLSEENQGSQSSDDRVGAKEPPKTKRSLRSRPNVQKSTSIVENVDKNPKERKRRMNIIYSRRKREKTRRHFETLIGRHAGLQEKNNQLREEEYRLMRLLQQAYNIVGQTRGDSPRIGGMVLSQAVSSDVLSHASQMVRQATSAATDHSPLTRHLRRSRFPSMATVSSQPQQQFSILPSRQQSLLPMTVQSTASIRMSCPDLVPSTVTLHQQGTVVLTQHYEFQRERRQLEVLREYSRQYAVMNEQSCLATVASATCTTDGLHRLPNAGAQQQQHQHRYQKQQNQPFSVQASVSSQTCPSDLAGTTLTSGPTPALEAPQPSASSAAAEHRAWVGALIQKYVTQQQEQSKGEEQIEGEQKGSPKPPPMQRRPKIMRMARK